jgi:hypothetical protein
MGRGPGRRTASLGRRRRRCPTGLPTTPTCIEAIEAQGLMGHLTTQNIGRVAAGTVDRALRGGAIYIPGFVNRVLHVLGSLVPTVLLAHLIGWRWRSARRRRDADMRTEQLALAVDRL